MRFLLMRHALPVAQEDLPDLQRPLSGQGEQDAARVGRWLVEAGWAPQRVRTSPARRAEATARAVAQAAGASVEVVERLYGAGALVCIRMAQEADGTLVVGHNPGLEEAVRTLAPQVAPGEDGRLLPPGTVACFEGDAERATLVHLVRPDGLP